MFQNRREFVATLTAGDLCPEDFGIQRSRFSRRRRRQLTGIVKDFVYHTNRGYWEMTLARHGYTDNVEVEEQVDVLVPFDSKVIIVTGQVLGIMVTGEMDQVTTTLKVVGTRAAKVCYAGETKARSNT